MDGRTPLDGSVLMNAELHAWADRGEPLRPMAQQRPAGAAAAHIR
ncbi:MULTISPECIES: hypothetical protein [unclassified Streptomyces]|nr:hypothetical protein [Streptomyces sp. SM10]